MIPSIDFFIQDTSVKAVLKYTDHEFFVSLVGGTGAWDDDENGPSEVSSDVEIDLTFNLNGMGNGMLEDYAALVDATLHTWQDEQNLITVVALVGPMRGFVLTDLHGHRLLLPRSLDVLSDSAA